ncbi:hypothetical protein BC939DRAFT_504237 [Gamsiella multidivaricata]|uniref:uncharacterized protein n=1 Tax=Gamsiella multidivaricata TaxID=101098 RepID=UPI00221FDB69|nr:uncharacterized protein BC939DRAFT_504237 [Gamsiella multidivaricata]KAG0365004.1 hypothetical protein BGZ54_006953 [Gamsiella multidivaricata]KAI7821712.1 hypothetical protein BC939DRAFT_504237 [Gamsiella multidivaricata]
MSLNQKQGKGAVTHSGGMRAEAKKTKVVFKNVLDTPFNIPWPEVTSEDNTIVLDVLCDLLKPIRELHNTHHNRSSIKPKQEKSGKASKKASSDSNSTASSGPNPALASMNEETPKSSSAPQSLPPPEILRSTVIGINAITKALERSIDNISSHPAPSAIFICKGDLVPAHLYSHLGPMVAMLPGTVLFPFLRGSERKLSEALGMPAVGAVAIKAGSKEAEGLIMILGRIVEPIMVSWLPKVTSPVAKQPKKAKSSAGAKVVAAESSQAVTTSTATSAAIANSTLASLTTAETPVVLTTSTSVISETTTTTTATTMAATAGTTPRTQKSSVDWIATNIKSIKTTMPIVVKTPKPAVAPTGGKGQNSSGGKGKNPQQQQQQQQQLNQAKGKRPALDGGAQGRGKGKRPRTD